MAIQYAMTIVNRIPSEAFINDSDDTVSAITPPDGTGWSLITVSVGVNKYILTWQKGGGTVTTNTSYQILSSDEVILASATTLSISITLPQPNINTSLCVKKIDNSINAVLVQPYSTETIDGQTSYQLSIPMSSVSLVSDGTNWFVV
jgi:hypothetical protein